MKSAPLWRDGGVMRAPAAMLCLLLIAGGGTSRAQPYTGPDGFAICPYAKGIIGTCAPLTDAAIRGYRLDTAQAGNVATLRRIAAKPAPELVNAIVDSKLFAAPRQFSSAGDYADYWFPDSANPGRIECGIHLRYTKDDLQQMTYAVDGRFIVLWTRTAAAKPLR